MSPDSTQQILHALSKSEHLLITTRTHPGGDAIASCLALYAYARKLHKKATIAIDAPHIHADTRYAFLAHFDAIATELKKPTDIVLSFDLPDNRAITGLTYRTENDKLVVTLFTEATAGTLKQPTMTHGAYPYDTIVVLDAPDLESLGSVYEKHTEFFYHTPIINIDHEPDNEHFGELNAVDVTALASCEILYTILDAWKSDALDADMCTSLLAGIMHESKSFQQANITPRALEIASALMNRGARREQIIEHIFRNKTIEVLQLWGRVLSRIKTDPKNNIAWSMVTHEDFTETKTTESSLLGVLDDFLLHVPHARAVLLMYPAESHWNIVVHTHDHAIDLRQLLAPLDPRGNKKIVRITIANTHADTAIESVLRHIRDRWPRDERMPQF